MPAPLSTDLRTRVVEAYEKGEGSYAALAERFCIGRATVERYVYKKRETGSVEPRREQSPGPSPKIDDQGLQVLRELLAEEPDRTDEEFAWAYTERTGVSVARSTINRAFARLGITIKKRRSLPKSETTRRSSPSGRRSKSGKRKR